jgi:NTP pyrophosphatase (non-canonical NTP hydrolase)
MLRRKDMEKQQEQEVYKEAIELFGITSQKVMVIEEMSELIKELCKELRDRGNVENIADELADVEITLAQIKHIYNIHDMVEEHKDFKLRRLSSIMTKIKSEQDK